MKYLFALFVALALTAFGGNTSVQATHYRSRVLLVPAYSVPVQTVRVVQAPLVQAPVVQADPCVGVGATYGAGCGVQTFAAPAYSYGTTFGSAYSGYGVGVRTFGVRNSFNSFGFRRGFSFSAVNTPVFRSRVSIRIR